jgi:hypothetical protein
VYQLNIGITSARNKVFFGARFYCALLTLHVSAPFGGHLQVVRIFSEVREEVHKSKTLTTDSDTNSSENLTMYSISEHLHHQYQKGLHLKLQVAPFNLLEKNKLV